MKKTIYNEPLWYKEWRDLGFECVNGPKAISLDIKQKNEHFQNLKKQHDVLVRKDGRFVLPELECLNPENLK